MRAELNYAVMLTSAILSLSLGGCSGSGNSSSQGEKLVIGSVIPLSGPMGHYGEDDKAGMEIAREELNSQGILVKESSGSTKKYSVDIRHENSYGGPNNTVNAPEQLEKLASSGVNAVVGEQGSGVTLALAPVANARRVVLITPAATNYKLRDAGPWVFRMLPNDYDQAVRMARYGRDQLKSNRAAILSIDNDYGRDLNKTFVESFSSSGGSIVFNRQFSEGQKEFSGLLTDLAKSNAQFLFLVGHTQEMADLLRTKERIEKKTGRVLPVLGTDGMYDETFIKQVGPSSEGIVLASAGFNPESEEPAVKRFVTLFRAKYGKTPSLWSASSYDAILLIAEAIRRGGPAAEAIRTNLLQVRVPGATGLNYFDSTGGISGKEVYVFIIRSGHFARVN